MATHATSSTLRPTAGPRLWLLPVAAVAGLLASWLVILATAPEPARAASEVRREIAEIVLRKSDRPNASDGGALGPWWVSALVGDAERGEFEDFQLKSASFNVAAKSARLVIDAAAGTFSFDLTDVVIMRTPKAGGDETEVAHIDRFTLGPAPVRGRIVEDPRMSQVVRARD